jgi:hypothetical protein
MFLLFRGRHRLRLHSGIRMQRPSWRFLAPCNWRDEKHRRRERSHRSESN